MGLLGLTSEVLTEYKADASQHKRELNELKAFQQQLGEAEGKAAAERNQHLGEWVEKLAKVALAITAVKEVGEILWDGFKDGIKDARLATQAHGIDIEKLTEATRGLITENNLLEFAAKANRSAFKNSQEDIENAAKAMVALQHRGVDAAEAQEAVTRALVEGKTKGLEPYGIVVDKHIEDLKNLGEENLTLAQKTEIHKNAMESLKTVADEVSDSQDDVGDSMQRAQVKLSNAWDDLKKELGKLVIAFEPVIEALAKVATLVTKIAGAAGDAVGGAKDLMTDMARGMDERAHPDRYKNMSGADVAGIVMSSESDWSKLQANMEQRWGPALQLIALRYAQTHIDESKIEIDKYEFKRDEEAEKKAATAALELVAKRILRSARGTGYDRSGTLGFNTDTMYGGIAAPGSGLADNVAIGGALDYQAKLNVFREKGISENELDEGQKRMLGAADMKQALQYAQEFLNRKTDNVLEKTFGKVGEFDLYKKSFEMLTGAVGNMYDAIVSGSESATAAFKKFIAGSVMAVGRQMAVEAVKEGAYAIGNLAFGNLAGAAQHAEAAAQFAAGAVLAGVVASELGAGGGGGGGGGGRGGGGHGSGATTGGGGEGGGGKAGTDRTLIVYADSFAEDSPRNRAQRAERLLNTVIGSGPVRYS